MLATAVPSGREFCVDYTCRCMYVAVHRMLFISPFSRDEAKGASSRSVTQHDHKSPRIRHLTCCHSTFLILTRRLSRAAHVPQPQGINTQTCPSRVIYLRRDVPCSSKLHPRTKLPSNNPPFFLNYYLIMKPSAHTLRGPPGGPASRALPARLLHTLFVFCATSLMLGITVIVFLFILLFRTIMSTPGPRRTAGRHVTFLEPSIVIPPPPPSAAGRRSPAKGVPSLSLTATPRDLEPPTPDVAEDPLRALVRICGFLASNTSRAWRGEELNATPPLAGLALYLDAVHEDMERINEMGADGKGAGGGGKEAGIETVAVAGAKDRESAGGSGGSEPAAAAGERAGTGAGAHVDAHDEPGLVRPDQAATHARRPPPPPPPSQPPHARRLPPPPLPPSSKLPTTPPVPVPVPVPSTSTRIPTPPAPEPSAQGASDTTTTATATATAIAPTNSASTPGPRKRKDAVLRTKRPSIDASNPDALADADDAAVRAAALLSRVADLGAGLFDGAVRERGAALWTAFSHRTPEVPVPSMPRTRFAAPPASGAEL